MHHNSKNKTTNFLRISIILVLLLSLSIFSCLAFFLNKQSGNTIRQISHMYMNGMSEQIAMHFETTIGLRLDQMDTLVKTIYSEDIHDDPVQQSVLIRNAKAREFTNLAFYYTDGSFEMLYGSSLKVTDPEPFLTSLKNGEKKVAVGTDENGNDIILLGVPSAHAPSEEIPCAALVAGLPTSYITDILSLEENDVHVYSFIIRNDGSFVIRTNDTFRENYFDRVRDLYEEVEGKDPELYIAALSNAMDNNEDYSAEFIIYGGYRQMHCTRLAHSEWFLLTCMPYHDLDLLINGFTTRWTYIVFSACILVLIVLFIVFAEYLKMTRQQIAELEKARQSAEEAQQAAVEAQQAAEHANRAKSEFLSNMSHDIRTPMNAIVGMTAIATSNIDDTQQVQNCLKKIALSSKHLLGLINDVLDMSKIESGKMTLNMDQVSLREVMGSIVGIVQPQIKAKRQRFDVSIHDISAENVCCDSVRLNQVLLNILGNAVKFTPEEGQIHVSMYEEPSDKGENYVRIHICIKDNGIGMTPEYKEKIFESFSREDSARVRKTEGSGLGMAITKYIVDTMGGTIEVDSELGKGSEFRVILDLEKSQIQEADMVLPDWRMLVVDDDKLLCESTVSSLKNIGISADWCLDAETAIDMVSEHHKKGDDYQIILLDWKLPGMDGISAARTIRQKYDQDIPILLISAYDWSEIEEEAKEAGIAGFIAKPLFKSTLFYGLKKFMDASDEPQNSIKKDESFDFSGKRILLAEDNELNWEIAYDLLSELGLELDWAENGQICVEKFSQSEVGYYHAILMDLRMPIMSGYQATEAIRALDRSDADIPIIAMTADAFSEDIQRCLDAGMNAHIAKPIDIKEVSRQLQKFIFKR